ERTRPARQVPGPGQGRTVALRSWAASSSGVWLEHAPGHMNDPATWPALSGGLRTRPARQLLKRCRHVGGAGDGTQSAVPLVRRVGLLMDPGALVWPVDRPPAETKHRQDVRTHRVAHHREARGRETELLEEPGVRVRLLFADDLDPAEQPGHPA